MPFEVKTGLGMGATNIGQPFTEAQAAEILRAIVDATKESYVRSRVASGTASRRAAHAEWNAARALLTRLLT